MNAEWSKWIKLSYIEDAKNSFPETPGIYIIKRVNAISRVGGIDRCGILYIGKSKNLRSRVRQFWRCEHTASGFLYTSKPEIGTLVFGKRCKSKDDIDEQFYSLYVKCAAPVSLKSLERAERAVLYAYVKKFGEAPPLNLSIPERWNNEPRKADLDWSKSGIK